MLNPFTQFTQHWFTIRTSIKLLTGLNMLVCIITVWSACNILRSVGIGGTFYEQVTKARALEADILPPPAFIVEIHLLMHDFGLDQTAPGIQSNALEFQRLKSNFMERAEYWRKQLPEGVLRSQLLEKAVPPALEYIELADAMFRRSTLESCLGLWSENRERLHLLFDTHLEAINELARMARGDAAASESAAIWLSRRRSIEFGAMGLALLATLAGINYSIGRHVSRRLAETTSLLERVAAGDLSQRLAICGNDEIDQLAGYLNQAIETSEVNLTKAINTATVSETLLAQLREQEALVRGILNSAPEAIITLDSQWAVIEFNPQAERLFGCRRADAVNKPLEDLGFLSENREWLNALKSTTTPDSQIRRVEAIVFSRSGGEVPVSLAVTEAQSTDSPITVISLMNIRNEQEIRRQIEALARFPDEIPAPVARIDKHGTVLYANRVAHKELAQWHISTGRIISEEALGHVQRTLGMRLPRSLEHTFDDRVFSLLLVPVVECGYVNVYGTDCTERKRAEKERQELNDQLIGTARQAGMAEIATGVLHNVGNVLNSVNVTTTLLRDEAQRSRVSRVRDLANLLREQSDLGNFFAADPRGIKLPEYLSKLADQLIEENTNSKAELDALTNHVSHIKSIIATQQSIASTSGLIQPCHFAEIVDEAIKFQGASIERHGIRVARDYAELPELMLDRQKIMQIVVNLIKNAKEAIRDSGHQDGCIAVTLRQSSAETVAIAVRDTGVGIAPEVIERIFAHGFTTKKDGHGFGLHSCANFATEMGGNLRLASDGVGHGATFTLELPFRQAPTFAVAN